MQHKKIKLFISVIGVLLVIYLISCIGYWQNKGVMTLAVQTNNIERTRMPLPVLASEEQVKTNTGPKIKQNVKSAENNSLPDGNEQPRKVVICVDPGHSAASMGNSANGLAEYRVTASTGQLLINELKNEGFYPVLIPRNSRQMTTDINCVEIARREHAQLFVRLHCSTGDQLGVTVYTPDQLQASESKRTTIEKSLVASRVLHAGMFATLEGSVRNNGTMSMSEVTEEHLRKECELFNVSEIPTLIIGIANIDNERDVTFIKSEEGQIKMAKALAHGIRIAILRLYGGRLSPEG